MIKTSTDFFDLWTRLTVISDLVYAVQLRSSITDVHGMVFFVEEIAVFPAEAVYSYFSADFRLKLSL